MDSDAIIRGCSVQLSASVSAQGSASPASHLRHGIGTKKKRQSNEIAPSLIGMGRLIVNALPIDLNG
ncbi:MAG: hypothetical protein CL862_00690 [Cyanobium sp. NAT70]|nr:hypothetical protein [Cyanobium sp. NAT70]